MTQKGRKSRESHALLTVGEAARTLRVSEETIRRRLDDGTLSGIRLGSVRRVFASELDRIATTRERETADARAEEAEAS